MIDRVLNFKTKTIGSAALILGISTFISGLLGVLKLRLLAEKFGAGLETDSFFAAFRVPDLISATLITGGIIVAFLPIFSAHFQKKEEKAWDFASNFLNIASVFLFFLCLLFWFLAPFIVDLVAPGFDAVGKEFTVSLARIMFISPLLFGISGIFSGILHHFNRFLSYALAPILYNIGIIFGILFFTIPFPEEQKIYGVAWGVVFGAFLHLLIQIPSVVKSGFKHRFFINWKDGSIGRAFKLMVPRTVGQASSQINLVVITAIASTLSVGSVAIFNFANNLYLFPVAIIGVSFAVAAFPSFSRSWAGGEREEFLNSFSSSVRQVLFIIVPLAFFIFILRAQIVRLVLGAEGFGWQETRLTAASLGIFALGLLFAALLPLVVRSFFSFQDTKTPAMAAVFSVLLNIALSFGMVYLLGHQNLVSAAIMEKLRLASLPDIRIIGLPLAISLTSFFHFSLLIYLLKKKVGDLPVRKIRRSFFDIFFASFSAGFACYLGLRIAVLFVRLETFLAVLFQFSVALLIGVSAYFIMLYLLGSEDMSLFIRKIRSIKIG